jgi:hypothetical protein
MLDGMFLKHRNDRICDPTTALTRTARGGCTGAGKLGALASCAIPCGQGG